MRIHAKRGRAVQALALTLAICTTGTWAQRARAEEQPEASAYGAEAKERAPFESMIETMIVTGRKRGEPVQQVPVAITQLDATDFEKAGTRRLDDVQSLVPNLLFDQGSGLANTSRTSLRGLSQNENSSASDPVVGIYVDGVYRTRLQASVLTLFDVDRVEVLRGPQGTLFGKNSVGGAISITTRKPEFDFGGDAQLRVGNYRTLESRLALNVPLVPEKAAARISLATATRDGYIKNVINNDDYLDNKLLGGRGQLLLLPRSDLEVLLAFEQTQEDRKGFGAKCVLLGPGMGVTGIIARDPMVGFREKCAEDAKRSEFKTAGDVSFTGDDLTARGASARVTWEISPDLTLTSISGWREQQVRSFFNVDATEVPLIQFQNDGGGDTQRQYSQEFQFTGTGMDGRLNYVVGLFELLENAHEEEFFGLGFVPIFMDPSRPPLVVPNPAFNRNELKVNNQSSAAYTQAKYSITERLDLTVGARITKDRKRVKSDMRISSCRPGPVGDPCRMQRLVGQGSMGPGSFTGFDASGRFSSINPSASLAYAFSPQFLVYASYATGFQSGGFDGAASSIEDTKELDNEDVTSYEVGIKSTWLDDKVTFNATAFYEILEDGTRVPVPTITDGGQLDFDQTLDADGLVRGGEIEFGLLPARGLRLGGNIGIQRAEFDRFRGDPDSGVPRQGLLPVVPNYTMNFSADYQTPLASLGTLGLRASWTYRGKMNPVIQATKQLDVGKVGLLDGRLSFALPDGRTEIAAYGTNLLNRTYFNAGFSAEDSFGFGVRFFAPPRFYGLELRRSF